MTVTPDQTALPDTLADPDSDIEFNPCSETGPIQTFLYWNGGEVANGARTLAYMTLGDVAGDCAPKFQVSDGCPCWVQKNEAVGNDGIFYGPAIDPAPWYDAAHPESAEFLGVLFDHDSERSLFDGLATRSVTPRIGGLTGATIGPAKLQPRTWKVQAWLISATCAGAEYGRRWLFDQLGANCSPCALGTMRVRSLCPPCDGTDNHRGEWYIYDVGLIDGPTYTGPVDPDCCCVEGVTFTLTAGNPYLYQAPVICASGQPVVSPGTSCMDFDDWFCAVPAPICCTVSPPTVGTLGTIIEIDTVNGAYGLLLETFALCPPASQAPTAQLSVPVLAANSKITIDSARRIITYEGPDGVLTDGTSYIQLPDGQGIPWVEISDCNPAACLCVGVSQFCGADATTTVTISTQLRQG